MVAQRITAISNPTIPCGNCCRIKVMKQEQLPRKRNARAEDKPKSPRAQRSAREITLHLRLIGSEVGEREKKAAHNSGPESVTLVAVERKVDGLKLSEPACHREGMDK